MTSYLFQFKGNSTDAIKPKLYDLINDFVMLTMDIENDVCFVSAKVVNQQLLDFYHWTPRSEDEALADQLTSDLLSLLDRSEERRVGKEC